MILLVLIFSLSFQWFLVALALMATAGCGIGWQALAAMGAAFAWDVFVRILQGGDS